MISTQAARAEAKRRLAAERAAEEARRAKAATALQSRARGRSATARTKEAFAAVVRVQAAWRCRVGAQALGQLLAKCPRLAELYLHDTNLSGAALQRLAEATPATTALTKLYLCTNDGLNGV